MNHLDPRSWTPLVLVALGVLGACAGPRQGSAVLGEKQVHYVDVDFSDNGGDVIVFVHGWGADGTVFDPQVAALYDKARLLVVDLPGHGKSDMPDEPFSMDLFARSLEAVMDDAGVKRAVLVGHSNGTPVVRQFWRHWPERVRALVLIDGALQPVVPEGMAEEFIALYTAPDYADRAEELAEGMVAGFPDALKPLLREVMLATPPETLAGGIRAAVDPAIWTGDPIEAPTLVVLAAQPTWTEEYLAAIPEIVPDVELHVWENVSHYLHLEEPERFHAVLFPFLRERAGFDLD